MNAQTANNCIRSLNQAILNLQSNVDNSDIVIDNIEEVVQVLHTTEHANSADILRLLNHALRILHRQDIETKAGRPALIIHEDTLEHLLSMDFKVPEIANLLKVSTRTIYNRMALYGLKVSDTYSQIDDEELDAKIEETLLNHPNTGYKRMRGFLRSNGIKVTVTRTQEAMRRVDPIGVNSRKNQNRAIIRREYYVKYSMQMWHVDTHHKLIRWGIIVRGGIDGKSRSIVYLKAGRDNTAASNLESFMEGVREFGVPLHTRSDKGGENVLIADYMIRMRGVNRGSHICGRSVHNQRIERLWRDVFYGCLSSFKKVFMWLEEEGHLQVDNPKHVAVLQFVFLPRINKNLQEFKNSWNLHPMSSENGKTPAQMMLLYLHPANYDLNDDGEENEIEPADDNLQDQAVNVEDFQAYLSEQEKENLLQINPLGNSDMFGSDIFINALNAIEN